MGWLKSETSSKPEPQPSATVDPGETIARFLTRSKDFTKTTGRIKYGTYLPASDGDTSVYRVSGISNPEISDIGEKCVREPRIKKGGECTIYGWSEVEASVILKAKVIIDPETTPHPRHANLKSWQIDKGQQKQQAIDIANKATYHS